MDELGEFIKHDYLSPYQLLFLVFHKQVHLPNNRLCSPDKKQTTIIQKKQKQ